MFQYSLNLLAIVTSYLVAVHYAVMSYILKMQTIFQIPLKVPRYLTITLLTHSIPLSKVIACGKKRQHFGILKRNIVNI